MLNAYILKMSNIKEKVFEALGEASMCWSKVNKSILDSDRSAFDSIEAGKYVFNSNLATTIGNKLVNDIKSDFFEMLTRASKNNYEPIHDGRWCKNISNTLSSEELYNNWLKEKNNEN